MRDLPVAIENQLTAVRAEWHLFAEFFFDSGTVRMWTGFGSIDYNGELFTGGGNLIGVEPIVETQDLEATGLKFSLSGVPTTLISLALAERYQGRPVKLYLATVSAGDSPIEISLYQIFAGVMDVMDFTADAEKSSIVVACENIATQAKRINEARYTDEEQQRRYPGDKFFEFTAELQDKEIVW